MNDFFSFRCMITPTIIKILCHLATVICVIMGVSWIINVEVYTGIALLVLGPLACRIQAELILILFEIHGELKRINK